MTKAQELLAEDQCFLIAPAGCGKTHTVAEAVALQEDGVQLVLTHTHAGVHSLSRKLNLLGVSRSRYHLDTIAGWALRFAKYYPKTTGFVKDFPANPKSDYPCIYSGVVELLRYPFMQLVINCSYRGVIVDEYQDCTKLQHELILSLAKIIPCRILGDPLQGIFDFDESSGSAICWNTDVRSNFHEIPTLDTPYRWKGKNERLGKWLMAVRSRLEGGLDIDLRTGKGAGVSWVRRKTTASANNVGPR